MIALAGSAACAPAAAVSTRLRISECPSHPLGRQLGVQLLAASLTALYTAAMTYAIAKAVDAAIGLRIADHGEEEEGLDLHQHGERGYNL